MHKAFGICLFVAIAGVSGTLHAGDVDCSSAKTYVYGTTYQKGDLVTYRCKDMSCPDEPRK
jgi:hypothetical protein